MGAVSDLRARLIVGAIGGIVGTVAMTATMRRLHAVLPAAEQYPLPPREITERTMPGQAEGATRDSSLLAHASFGAAAGAAMAAVRLPSALQGSGGGLVVWFASYFGWVPASHILRRADRHPLRRNLLMLLAHLVWGSVTAVSARELLVARETMLADGPIKDASGSPGGTGRGSAVPPQ